jgi:2-dehydro-3-deoxygalactonokinase
MSETSNEATRRLLETRAIALDGGTTNTRARLIVDGRILATARREIGVRDTALVGPGSPSSEEARGLRLAQAVHEVLAEVGLHAGTSPAEVVAAGMLSSELGLAAVPHVLAPAGVAELAAAVAIRSLPEVWPEPIHFVPGVRTPAPEGPDGWMRGDVMRGEECETLGALWELERQGSLDPDAGRIAFVWPGSHTKLVEVDRSRRIVGSHTSLAGELLQAVARNTLLRASLPEVLPERLDPAAVAAGARAVAEQGIGRAAFLVRVAALEQAMGPDERAAFWISAVVADDCRGLARHPIVGRARWIGVGGREPLRGLYAEALERQAPGAVVRLGDDTCERASALGALAVVIARGGGGRGGLSPR